MPYWNSQELGKWYTSFQIQGFCCSCVPTCPDLSCKNICPPIQDTLNHIMLSLLLSLPYAIISASKTLSFTQLPTFRCLTNFYSYFKTQYKNHFPWELLLIHTRLCFVISHTYLCYRLTTFCSLPLNKLPVNHEHLQGGAMVSSLLSPSKVPGPMFFQITN